MRDTATTTEDRRTAGILAHGLMAVGQHMISRRVPRPMRIDLADGEIAISLYAHDAERWWLSLGGIEDAEVTPTHLSDYERVTLRGLLPDSGVRVQLIWLRSPHAAEVSA